MIAIPIISDGLSGVCGLLSYVIMPMGDQSRIFPDLHYRHVPQLQVTDHMGGHVTLATKFSPSTPAARLSPTCSGKASSVKGESTLCLPQFLGWVFVRYGRNSTTLAACSSCGHRQFYIRYPLFAPSYIRSA